MGFLFVQTVNDLKWLKCIYSHQYLKVICWVCNVWFTSVILTQLYKCGLTCNATFGAVYLRCNVMAKCCVSLDITMLHVITLTARLLSVDGKELDGAGGNK